MTKVNLYFIFLGISILVLPMAHSSNCEHIIKGKNQSSIELPFLIQKNDRAFLVSKRNDGTETRQELADSTFSQKVGD